MKRARTRGAKADENKEKGFDSSEENEENIEKKCLRIKS
jgi:hypothetical protein